MKVTVKDIANETHFSIATVSLALSGKPSRISEETKKTILDTAERMNYKPNYIAQSLVTSRSYTIGMIVPNFSDQIFTSFASGLENYAQKKKYSTFICNSNDNVARCISQVNILESRGVDGMVIIPPAIINTDPMKKTFCDTLEKSELPYVLVDRAVHDLFHDYVASDNIYGGELAGKHLKELGHRKIGIIAGPEEEYGTIKRLKGFMKVFEDTECSKINIYYSDYTADGGYISANRLLSEHRVTAVFALNDMMAIGAYRAIGERGMKIPGDISVIGFDNNPVSPLVAPPLTTISQPFNTIGNRACELLLERIDAPDKKNCDYFFSPSIVVRSSTKAI